MQERQENIPERGVEKVPYIVHEGEVARLERTIKRFVIIIVTTIVLLFASNALWLYAWCQYDYTSDETQYVKVDGKEGSANYIGHDGDINGSDNSR